MFNIWYKNNNNRLFDEIEIYRTIVNNKKIGLSILKLKVMK